MKRIIIVIVCLMITYVGATYAQNKVINYEDHLSGQNPNEAPAKKLVYIDFWATWCIPCIKVMSYIDYQKELYGSDVYFASMSSETSSTIKKFLQANHLATSVLKDVEQENHNEFNVKSLPYGVLIDRTGSVLWEGHPSDLSHEELGDYVRNAPHSEEGIKFYRKKSVKKYAEEKFRAVKVNQLFKNYDFKYYFSDVPLSAYTRWENNVLHYEGRVSGLIAEIMGVPMFQVVPGKFRNKYIKIQIPKKMYDNYREDIIEFLEEKLKMRVESQEVVDTLLELTFNENSMLLNDSELNYGEGMTIISEMSIEADAISSDEFAQLLSNVIEKRVVFVNAPKGKYDWKLHVQFPNLMYEQLRSEYLFDVGTTVQSGRHYTLIPN